MLLDEPLAIAVYVLIALMIVARPLLGLVVRRRATAPAEEVGARLVVVGLRHRTPVGNLPGAGGEGGGGLSGVSTP